MSPLERNVMKFLVAALVIFSLDSLLSRKTTLYYKWRVSSLCVDLFLCEKPLRGEGEAYLLNDF